MLSSIDSNNQFHQLTIFFTLTKKLSIHLLSYLQQITKGLCICYLQQKLKVQIGKFCLNVNNKFYMLSSIDSKNINLLSAAESKDMERKEKLVSYNSLNFEYVFFNRQQGATCLLSLVDSKLYICYFNKYQRNVYFLPLADNRELYICYYVCKCKEGYKENCLDTQGCIYYFSRQQRAMYCYLQLIAKSYLLALQQRVYIYIQIPQKFTYGCIIYE